MGANGYVSEPQYYIHSRHPLCRILLYTIDSYMCIYGYCIRIRIRVIIGATQGEGENIILFCACLRFPTIILVAECTLRRVQVNVRAKDAHTFIVFIFCQSCVVLGRVPLDFIALDAKSRTKRKGREFDDKNQLPRRCNIHSSLNIACDKIK